ncbi:MAG TPA: class I SAM-dependent methyltransferase [Pyrinomonadaceae bacterium]|nr:class I SAM-dependent methyltransferase [Pyrinomonadaceae bacterium]
MGTTKSEKELAFLQELFVATDWGERFAHLMDEHVELPKKGRMLYVASGAGGHAMRMQERAGDDVTLTCVDESEECLELGRAKAAAVKAEPEFYRTQLETLPFEDDQFDLVVGDASLVAVERLPEMISEMVRVAAPGGTVALSLATNSSFGEFFSVYWEALRTAGFEKHEHDVESLITELPTVSAVEDIAEREGLDGVTSWTQIEEFDYESGEEFLNAPLITDFLLRAWLESLPDEEMRMRVSQEIARIIDAERQDMDFSLTVKATLIIGRKAEVE